jgi:hypothetical protein
VTALQAAKLAVELGLGVVEVIKALRAIGCFTCDPVLEPADAPDLLGQSLANRTDLARRATGTDREAVDAAFKK